jgi:hypothetical protein
MVLCSGAVWEIFTFPVVSGMYRVDLYSIDYPEWNLGECPWCIDCSAYKPCEYGPSSAEFVTSDYVKVNNEAIDYLAFTDLFYVSSDDQDTVRSGSTMEVAKEYDIVCRYLEPEDVIISTQKAFIRDPAGDEIIPCNQNYPYRTYGYRCYDSFKPYTLFPHIEPHEWSELTRYLDCTMYADENDAERDYTIRTTIMAGLQLDCTNDSTVCFRPTAGEDIQFVFRYAPEMGLNPEMDIRFRVSDKDGITVYDEPLFIPYHEPFQDEFDFPEISAPDTMVITWDGRQNMGDNAGHLANPHLDSYSAIVQIFENQIMETNIETFDVVPTIDSLMLTHYPWYPPPLLRAGIDVYTLIKAKIDDSESPEYNYRYYIPEGTYLPHEVSFWDGINFKYRDLPAEWGQVFYYRDFRDWYNYNIYLWKSSKWGDISYKWIWVDDFAESGGAGPSWWQRPGYQDYDMTSFWGHNWKLHLQANLQWSRPALNVEMRLLLRSKVINYKDTYLLQDFITPGESESHAVITGPTTKAIQNWDINDWAITQMGTPYYTFGKDPYPQMGKRPYVFNDCSGLVISARIQDIGVSQNEWYRLNHIAVFHMVQNYYPYPPPDGDPIPLGLTEITEAEAERNDIILIAEKRKPFKHVVILDKLLKLNGIINRAYLIHAKGGNEPEYRQVRYDSFLGSYSRYKYNYKFLRFEE